MIFLIDKCFSLYFLYNIRMKCPVKKEKICCSGIYGIKNILNNKIYIGSTKSFYRRYYEHIAELKSNKHDNPHLQNAWNKYGSKNFSFDILCYCEVTELIKKEDEYIERFKATQKGCGYNLHDASGTFHSKETRNKMSKIQKSIWKKKGYLSSFCKNIYKFDVDGKFIKKHLSIRKAAEEMFNSLPKNKKTTIESISSNICACANNKVRNKTCQGFQWSYTMNLKGKKYRFDASYKNTKVHMLDQSGKFLKEFDSIKEATKYLRSKTTYKRASAGTVSCVCGKLNGRKYAYGFKWKYA